ncbi:MAG: type II toxin-antitoxin system RelE/ParE family toxin [Methylotenera sp.]|nr:type II toxin-antitoxin system RelE/ParE family toxin [Methylotenera sp.]MDP1755456.1 type II toxin-antitoxin system RelE/ParE family toxin [Methylotenera sp.]MDP1960550.1 type II toxin-antitoxin system RelE/ParE family toxin [Methylotenera sp.]MDP3302961.1 type II toxin-antitoxin system RelE/ParE family toxin [Methylotenera sp.]MDP3943193.1 type II toxin-antitoxin system RelE/ParE family toxin [Methylotenera sp.]
MASIELAPEISEDFQRILDHLLDFQVGNPSQRIDEIIDAINILSNNPLIGRPVVSGQRELIIGRSRSNGYIALYRYISAIDTVFVLAIMSQNEAGYADRVSISELNFPLSRHFSNNGLTNKPLSFNGFLKDTGKY